MTLVYALDHPPSVPEGDLARLIGGKAAGLAVMTVELGLPVPPGFVITTAACRQFLAEGWPVGLDAELDLAVADLERAVGRQLGDADNPLLVSVRSGAPMSMPGMMDTILNLGLNTETTRGLAAVSGDAQFARDCRERLVAMFTRIVGANDVPEDPRVQLRAAVEAVFRSWNSDRARAYRQREGIAENLGTAVTVQAMVFGNWGADSATGVVFTRNPANGEQALYGDILFVAQGEEVVAGTHRTEPVAALDARLPVAGAQLREFCTILERHFSDLCEIEFTIERGKLWLLQSRIGKRSPRAALRVAVDMAEDPDFPVSRTEAVERVAHLLVNPPVVSTGRRDGAAALATGLPASPGVASGEIATTSAAAVTAADAGRQVILVRADTSPEDVRGMGRAAGVLTSRGGLASHAAVVARGWGIPAVVGAQSVSVGDQQIAIGSRILKAGEVITIDGDSGEIYLGAVAAATALAPEAETLRAWASQLGIPIGASSSPVAETATPKVPMAGQARWEEQQASAALDEFHPLDVRVKDVVTAWQLRGSTLNDHSDAVYDSEVLDRLAAIHRDAAAWLSSLADAPDVVRQYLARLDHALEKTLGGDHLFIASPRVDSYHSVWFELHEELIRLAGRTRADEAAAGRA